LYSIQPGDHVYYPGGDQPSIAQAPVRGYSRHFMLLIAEAMKGTVESEYAQYWCNHVLLDIDDIDVMIPWISCSTIRSIRSATIRRRFRPLSRRAAAWAHSRSNWSGTGIRRDGERRPHRGHQHRDQNAL
jgi:hypothetical protein